VLITLGIIGVVSAMTIPALMNKCQKIVLANQAKKEYAMWTQVFKNILADNNTTSLSETELWGKIQGDYSASSYYNPTIINTAFWSELGKYVKISPSATKDEEYYNNDARYSGYKGIMYKIYLANGSKLRVYSFSKTSYRKTDEECSKIKELGGSMCSEVGYMDIDVNGNKGPNVYGRDIFEFYLSDEGVLYPWGGKDVALYYNQTDLASNRGYWKNIYNGTKEQNANIWGGYRTGQLMEEGWKMNY
jgi:Tfp pilus assembly protein PilE